MGEPDDYVGGMVTLSKVIGRNLEAIRKRLHGTQEKFAEAAGMTQPTLSRLEAGVGLTVLDRMGEHVLRAGGDPMDLLTSEGEVATPEVAEIRQLLMLVDRDTHQYLLTVLRKEVALASGERVLTPRASKL